MTDPEERLNVQISTSIRYEIENYTSKYVPNDQFNEFMVNVTNDLWIETGQTNRDVNCNGYCVGDDISVLDLDVQIYNDALRREETDVDKSEVEEKKEDELEEPLLNEWIFVEHCNCLEEDERDEEISTDWEVVSEEFYIY